MDQHSFSALDHHAVPTGSDDDSPWVAGTMLALESCDVMRMRLEKLAYADQEAEREAALMVGEKIAAGFEALSSWFAGATPAAVINRLREQVAANARRLSAGH